MLEFFSKLNGGELIGLAAVVGGLSVAATGIIASQWRRVRVAEMAAALKQQMLDKGMSAAEIEQVIKAGQQADDSTPIACTGNEAFDKAALVQRMMEHGYEGADIERVLKAYQPAAKATDEKPLVNKM